MELNKKIFQVVDINDTESNIEYWLAKTPEERLEALYFLRKQIYWENEIRKGLQRVLTVVDRL